MPCKITNHEQKIDVFRRTNIVSKIVLTANLRMSLILMLYIFGQNYTGKKVEPSAHLLKFESNKAIILENTWEANLFYILKMESGIRCKAL